MKRLMLGMVLVSVGWITRPLDAAVVELSTVASPSCFVAFGFVCEATTNVDVSRRVQDDTLIFDVDLTDRTHIRITDGGESFFRILTTISFVEVQALTTIELGFTLFDQNGGVITTGGRTSQTAASSPDVGTINAFPIEFDFGALSPITFHSAEITMAFSGAPLDFTTFRGFDVLNPGFDSSVGLWPAETVPAPSALLLMLAGLGGLWRTRRSGRGILRGDT